MGCGLPVVCSNLPGVTDMMVVSGETGFLVTVDDLAGFTDAVISLYDDPALGQKMGATGQRRTITNFGFEPYCRKLTYFYHQVAGDAHGQLSDESKSI